MVNDAYSLVPLVVSPTFAISATRHTAVKAIIILETKNDVLRMSNNEHAVVT